MVRWTKSGLRGVRGEYAIDLQGLRPRKPNRPKRWRRWLPRVDWRKR